METRIGVIGIILESNEISNEVNDILHKYSNIVMGRMGVPYKAKGVSVISLIVDGNLEDINALTGKLGNIKGVSVKTAISKV